MGGVETLIRNIQNCIDDLELYEVYELFPNNEYYDESYKIKYIKFGNGGKGVVRKILNKIKQISAIANIGCQAGDVIIIFHPNDIAYIPISALRICKVIVVQTNRFDKYFTTYSKFLFLFFIRYVDYFCVYTPFDADRFYEKYPYPKLKVEVIPRGCKLVSANTTTQYSKKLITISRLEEEQKNFQDMIDVVNMLPDDYSLDIYGDGSEQEVASLKRKLSGNSKVSYKGVAIDVAEILRNYSVFLMTSRYEGFGQTLIEARSQGLPLVVYDTFDALPWILKDGVNGYRVPFGNLKLFCDKIQETCQLEQKYCELSSNSLEMAQETDLQMVNEKWKKLIL
jgi:glycosyltransferase involved in cell wall biosynthesis